ncbi:hypothetical protein F5I97DRAFT_1894220 [Phlebopus sp. FC_14]|nr:hypothetical protein F5I97DRAFT_1894220 [Phlebopus sp. FC_14]
MFNGRSLLLGMALRPSTTTVVLLLFLLLCVVPVQGVLNKWEVTNFCKCICFQSNYSILQMDTPDDPSKPCLSCTKAWCLNQNLSICLGASLGDTDPDTATGKEGDVEARCFQRDSPRDQLVVTLFLLTVLGLLLGAGIKSRMLKAGMDPSLPWWTGRRWWEVCCRSFSPSILTLRPCLQVWLPRRHSEYLTLGERSAPHRLADDRGEYREVSESLPM